MALKNLTVESLRLQRQLTAICFLIFLKKNWLRDVRDFKHKPGKMILEVVKPFSLAKTAASVPEISLPRLLQES